MTARQKRILAILFSISCLYFAAFILPNNTGADDQMMISLFETDEFAQYPVVIRMLTPRQTFDKTLLNFIEYRHYYYGSPFYFSSALLLLPVKLLQALQNTQLNMLLLRQVIGVFPMIAALLLLTWSQTKLQSYTTSIALFVLLLSVPAVVENNMWWHADSLAVFFVALTFFFLEVDNLRFGTTFHLAAASVGLAAGTKVIGFFFFIAIPAYVLVGVWRGQLTWRLALARAASFVGIMAATIVVSNPFLLLGSEFERMLNLMTRQAAAMSAGWTLFYAKGPASWVHIIEDRYGSLLFIALALIALGVGIWRGENRVRHLLIAAWAIPFGLYILFTIAIKPTHFFLPILLPVFSSLVVLFEFPPFARTDVRGAVAKRPTQLVKSVQGPGERRISATMLWGALVLGILGSQFVMNIQRDVTLYTEVLSREQNEGSFVFYGALARDYLPRIPADAALVVFRDVRMYFPEDPRWTIRTYWNSNYKTIEKIEPDLIILWAQRILDYTQEGAQESAINPESFQDTYQFFVDADHDQLRGYRLVYRDQVGLFFVSDAAYAEFFQSKEP